MINWKQHANKIALAGLLLVLVLVNFSIYQKEQQLVYGKVVYLELAPVDPRSIMQGDYMALRFMMGREVQKALHQTQGNVVDAKRLHAQDGHLIATVNANKVATFKALYSNQALADDEVLLQYRVRNNRIKFATNAFFFQEGHAKVYEAARYGQFRVNSKGAVLLAAMYDKDLNKLVPNTQE